MTWWLLRLRRRRFRAFFCYGAAAAGRQRVDKRKTARVNWLFRSTRVSISSFDARLAWICSDAIHQRIPLCCNDGLGETLTDPLASDLAGFAAGTCQRDSFAFGRFRTLDLRVLMRRMDVRVCVAVAALVLLLLPWLRLLWVGRMLLVWLLWESVWWRIMRRQMMAQAICKRAVHRGFPSSRIHGRACHSLMFNASVYLGVLRDEWISVRTCQRSGVRCVE